MKTILTLAIVTLGFISAGQSSFYSVQTDNDDSKPVHLYVLPWADDGLIQVNLEFDPSINGLQYSMDYISLGIPLSFYIPNCYVLSSKPAFLEDGILATGKISSIGVELIYFDGITSTIFDINSAGDSDPRIIEIDEDVFVIAEDSTGARQLFKFDEASLGLSQVSLHLYGEDVTQVVGVRGDYIYYQVEFENGSDGIYQMRYAIWNGSAYQATIFIGIALPLISNYYYVWNSLIFKWGEMFILQQKLSTNPSDPVEQKVIAWGAAGYDDYIKTSTNYKPISLFEFEDKIMMYQADNDTLFSYEEQISNNPPSQLSADVVLTSKVFDGHVKSENNRLYFITKLPNNSHEVVRYESQSLTPVFSSSHVHPRLEDDGIVYFSNFESEVDSNSVILLNTAWDGVDEVKIDVGQHAPVMESAVMYQDKYTFLFIDGAHTSTDVLQLLGSPLLSIPELDYQTNVYPNPLNIGDITTVNSTLSGEFMLVSLEGKQIQSGTIKVGLNQLRFDVQSSGVYLLKVGNSTTKLVVQ